MTDYRYIGQGVYSLTEAERLSQIPRARIRRWMEGYEFVSRGKRRMSPPIVTPKLGRDAGELALTFAELIEIRFLDAFLEKGVSWTSIRKAADNAREIIGSAYPFSHKSFKTDGKTILAEIVHRNRRRELLDLVQNQYELGKVVLPRLFAGIDFNQFDEPDRWWPLNKRKGVIIDPRRAFGAPIVVDGGVPTSVLHAAAKAERSARRAALLFDVPELAVRHAVEFETKFAA